MCKVTFSSFYNQFCFINWRCHFCDIVFNNENAAGLHLAQKHNVEMNFAKITQSTSRKNQHSKVKDPPVESQGIDLPIMPVSKRFCLNDEKSNEEKDGSGIFPPNGKSNN